MGQVLTFPRSPVRPIPANSDRAPATLADLRACLRYCDLVELINRNFFTATRSTDPAAVELARATLRHIRDLADYPQARSLAAMYLKIATRPDGPGDAA